MHATWRNETQNEYVMREKEREASYYTFLHTNAFDKRTYIHTYIPNESWGQVSGGSECESKFTWLVLLLTNRVLDCSTCSRNFHVSYIPLSFPRTHKQTHTILKTGDKENTLWSSYVLWLYQRDRTAYQAAHVSASTNCTQCSQKLLSRCDLTHFLLIVVNIILILSF